ncbi:hypothetical protein Athai_40740 [Actinocatenispora thailandica]|uniref:Tox-REase-5 domain-containing protein n=1 Tax=Actinocatenispora thailandica TaxID=227318 RepID=A0A7R7DRV8_9ACTN|nr:Tox-REase-5 domain-containing protein [Actinocatenispora thailandica]BCJ36571.1 hypothetical protein Athai_40740 [Actinocatenispora thailandica]
MDVQTHGANLRRRRGARSPVPRLARLLAGLVAVLCVVLLAPAAAAAAADTDGGPGKWYAAPNKTGGPKPGSQAWKYEQQFKSQGHGNMGYWVPKPATRNSPGFDIDTWIPKRNADGTWDGVEFDGYDPNADNGPGKPRGALVDAKGARYAYLLDYQKKNGEYLKARRELLKEATRQVDAAGPTKTPIDWHFAEESAHQKMNGQLGRMGIRSNFTDPKNPSVFDAPGSPADPEGIGVQRGAIPTAKPGGIDLSSVRLNYLSADDSHGARGIKYSFNSGTGALSGKALEQAREQSDAFFVWLELQPSTFWVNLNPAQPDKIIDPQLARTDVGKVLLSSDLELKREFTRLQNPDTPTGAEFFRKIYLAGPDSDHCLSYRAWITPKPASVRQTNGSLYILDAPLRVRTATLYTTDPKTGKRTCPGQSKARADYNQRVLRQLLVPKVEQAINSDSRFATLRRVYLSRVAAEWYRQVSAKHDTMYRRLINQGILGPWVSRTPWSPRDIYDQYLKEYDATTGSIVVGSTTYSFHYGGVDFSRAPSAPVSQQQFAAKHPQLPKTVDKSIDKPTTDPDDDTTWAGGTVTVARDSGGASPPPEGQGGGGPVLPVTGTPLWSSILVGLVLLASGFALVYLFRRRRQGRHAA